MNVNVFLAGAVTVLAVALASPLSSAQSGSKPNSSLRPITHDALWQMRRLGSPQLSPDGRWVAVVVTQPTYEATTQSSDIWLVPTEGTAAPRQLTFTNGRESGIDWSPDSRRIAFSAKRDGDDVEQIYVLMLGGGDAMRVTGLSTGARAPVFSPDGSRIAFTSSVYPGALSDADNRSQAAERLARKWKARIYDGFPIRNWDAWVGDRQSHVFVQVLPAPGKGGAPARDLLAGSSLARDPAFTARVTDSGDELDSVWAPDGESILFVASTDQSRAAYALTSSQIWRVSAAGGDPVRLTRDSHRWSRPRFTADGRHVLALVERQTDKVYVKTDLVSFGWSGRDQALDRAHWITEGWDRSVTTFAVTPDSRRVYLLAEDAGHELLHEARIDAGAVRRVFDMTEGVYTALSTPMRIGSAPLVVGLWESATRPPEVVRIDPKFGEHRVLTNFNTSRTVGLDLPPVRHFAFVSKGGRRIHSLLVLPPAFDASRKYPLFNVIHGGPHTMWRDQWVLRWNYHLLAAPGYVLLLTNYSGSTGFGEAFAQTIQGDPLRTAGAELNEAADEALRQFSFIDDARQCAGGASYGGHLANWLQASTTRYRCLVSHAGLINLESQWGTSDTVYSRELNNGGPVWEQGPIWREQNPIRYAAQFRTPTLVTIGEQDFRVPLNNSLEYWTVLQRRQIPSRLVVFPDENHWILDGENSRLFYSEIANWLARWLAP